MFSTAAHSCRTVIGHHGYPLPRHFGTAESRDIRADLTAGVGRSWSVGIAPLGQGPLGAPLEQSPAWRPQACCTIFGATSQKMADMIGVRLEGFDHGGGAAHVTARLRVSFPAAYLEPRNRTVATGGGGGGSGAACAWC